MDTASTPTMQAVLEALREGPATSDELKTRTGTRRRTALDKAISELNSAGLIAQLDPVEGEAPRWVLAEHDQPEPDRSQQADSGEQVDPGGPGDTAEQSPDTGPVADSDPAGDANDEPTPAAETTAAMVEQPPDRTSGDKEFAGAETVKTCRFCKEEMPVTCPCCWQKTPVLCGKCRQIAPAARRANSGEPEILANGLPKLRSGQMAVMVLEIMRSNPLPTWTGTTGWTAARIAVHLPGRSQGAIRSAFDKLTGTGQVELLGEDPMRYQLKADGDTQPAATGSQPDTSAPPETSSEDRQSTSQQDTASDPQ